MDSLLYCEEREAGLAALIEKTAPTQFGVGVAAEPEAVAELPVRKDYY